MAKNLKLNIKNEQIAQAINLSGLKNKLADKKATTDKAPVAEKNEVVEKPKAKAPVVKATSKSAKIDSSKNEPSKSDVSETKEDAPKIRARSRSAFAEPQEMKTGELLEKQQTLG
ncbi:MAG: translation initiation factor IF-2, partial [Parachlamydiaceae bacterium]